MRPLNLPLPQPLLQPLLPQPLLPLQLLPLLSICQSRLLSIVPVNRTSRQSRILSIVCPVNSVLSITNSTRSPHYRVLPRCGSRYYHCNYYRCSALSTIHPVNRTSCLLCILSIVSCRSRILRDHHITASCHAAAAAAPATTTIAKLCPPYILSIRHPVNHVSCQSRILSITCPVE